MRQKKPFLFQKWAINSSSDHMRTLSKVKGLKDIIPWPFYKKLQNLEKEVNIKRIIVTPLNLHL
jgi:uncharacterized Fe-S cluster-containing radical SAM superfamily enzyme